MAAVVRVKRALGEEPNTGIILSCKRRKTESNTVEDAVETLFKFAGTVKDQEENIALLHPEKLLKTDLKTASRPTPNVSEKVRAQTKQSSRGNRYKLVNYFRALGSKDQSDSKEDSNQNSITVLDVEPSDKQISSDSKATEEETGEKSNCSQFVYDLYYIQPDAKDIDVDDLLLDGLVSFAPLESDLVFDSYRNNVAGGRDSDSDPDVDDDDDSNDENNWRNDYPDEEGESDGDDGLASGFGKITFELSSDGDDEQLIYTEDLSQSDLNLYGSAYARFKKKALKEMDPTTEINSNSDNGNSSGSDDSEADRFE